MKMTAGRGVDTAIEAVGIPATFELCQEIVAPGGTAVARREQNGDALGGGLLPEGAPKGVAALAQLQLALAIADADDPGLIVFHGAHRSQGEAAAQRRSARGVQQDRGSGRN